jgi:hypothetical protein
MLELARSIERAGWQSDDEPEEFWEDLSSLARDGMRNLYSITTNQAAIAALFCVIKR